MFNRVVAAGCFGLATVAMGAGHLLQNAVQQQEVALVSVQQDSPTSLPIETGLIAMASAVEQPPVSLLPSQKVELASVPNVELGADQIQSSVTETPATPSVPAIVMQPTPLLADITVSNSTVKSDARLRDRKTQVIALQMTNTVLPPVAHTVFCLRYPDECREPLPTESDVSDVEMTSERHAELNAINTSVNQAIRPTRALGETAATEKWVISPENGDCNDFAVTKRHLLLAKGWPARALLLAEVIVNSGEHHLILIVRTSQGDFVLDNLNDQMRSAHRTGYEWVRMQTPDNPKYWAAVRQPGSILVAARSGMPQRTLR